jgi:hypothetical protein
MSIRYATIAMTGLNDASKTLKCADAHPHFWDAFADAKAVVVARAEILNAHLASSQCSYRMRSESGDHHYEISVEYGSVSLDRALPFKTVFHVYECTIHSWIQEVQQ